MTGKHFLQLIKRLKLPFTMKNAIQILSQYDERITERIERPITFVQFGESLLKLILQQKERETREALAPARSFQTPSQLSTAGTESPVPPKEEKSSTATTVQEKQSESETKTI